MIVLKNIFQYVTFFIIQNIIFYNMRIGFHRKKKTI